MSDLPTTPLPGSTPDSTPSTPSTPESTPESTSSSAPEASGTDPAPANSQPTVPLNVETSSEQPTVPLNMDAPSAEPTVPLNLGAPSAQPTVPLNLGAPPAQPTSAEPTAPLNTDAWASVPQAAPMAPSAPVPPRRNRPRFSTILWGVLLLVFAGFMVAWTVLPITPDPTLLLLGAVIAIGISLVAAGIAAASRRAD